MDALGVAEKLREQLDIIFGFGLLEFYWLSGLFSLIFECYVLLVTSCTVIEFVGSCKVLLL